jgi:AcrR family transcriptional regulator
MARRARKAGGKAASKSKGEPVDRLIDAALTLAERQGWRRTGLAEIAAEAGLPLDQAYAACPTKLGLLARFHRRIDRAALAGAVEAGEASRDRLFDTLMRRFDALAPHRGALRSMLRDSLGDPAALLGLPALVCSMGWMLERAGLSAAGWRGRMRAHLLAGLYMSVLRVFLEDDSADLAKTMAALDRGLRGAERWLGLSPAEASEGALLHRNIS